ncbi:hypothetical protein, partial [Pseudomonas viridiflava]|uniref:hypothetical protein n=1 Tax=Pseudomonas viridiflava TaxID=33069 RepID=UPI00197E92AB
IQGVGAGGIIALTEIVVSDLVAFRFHGQRFGMIFAIWRDDLRNFPHSLFSDLPRLSRSNPDQE